MGLMFKAIVVAAIGVGLYCLKQYNNGGVCLSEARIDGKVVIVTGANTGIGKETAADLALRGGKIYLACRSLERGSKAITDILEEHPKLDKKSLILMKLDLGSISSTRSFVSEFKKKEKKLDILINNAGVMFVDQGKTEDGFEITFGVNHLGHFLLTNLLMTEILAASPSRVVTVSSRGHRHVDTINLEDPMLEDNFSKLTAYPQSKLANIIFSQELAKRLQGTGVTTYSLHPGAIPTELGRHVSVLGHPLVSPYAQKLLLLFLKGYKEGAQTQICCAVDEKLAAVTGKYYSDCEEVLPESQGAFDDELSVKLWDLSVKLLNMENKEIHEKLR